MTYLRKLKSRPALLEDFLNNSSPSPIFDPSNDSKTVVVDGKISLDDLDQVIEKYMELPMEKGKNDYSFAREMHAALGIHPSLAAQKEIWWWLAVCKYPDYVARRWKQKDKPVPVNRYIGIQVKQTFSRLWWMVELTKRPKDDFTLTDKLIGFRDSQDVFEHLYGRSFFRYPVALEAWIEMIDENKLGTANMREIRNESFLIFNCMMATLVVESMAKDDIRDKLEGIVSGLTVKM